MWQFSVGRCVEMFILECWIKSEIFNKKVQSWDLTLVSFSNAWCLYAWTNFDFDTILQETCKHGQWNNNKEFYVY